MPRIVRFRDLGASWSTKQARQPGFMRWLVTWMGGPMGHINTNPGFAVESTRCAVGMMVLPPGQRQAGRHIHGVTEVYVVLQGESEGFDASDHPHRAGPVDCTYIPPGCPHGVRNCGVEDVALIWVHDGIECNDAAVYYADGHVFDDPPPIELVRFCRYAGGLVRTGGARAWYDALVGQLGWRIGGFVGFEHRSRCAQRQSFHRDDRARSWPQRAGREAAGDAACIWLARVRPSPISAQATLRSAVWTGCNLPAGEAAVLRNNGPAAAHMLWVDCLSS